MKHSLTERHRDYKHFDRTKFKNNPNKKSSEKVFLNTNLSLLRKKFLRAKHAPYITKTLRKAIMRRSQLETKYLKTKTQTDLKLYKKHKNFCSKLHKRDRRKYYESLDMKNVLDSKKILENDGTFYV